VVDRGDSPTTGAFSGAVMLMLKAQPRLFFFDVLRGCRG
jgi:hypothetical protein